MADVALDRLLQDADLVVNYGIRAGMLGDGALGAALARARAATTLEWRSAEVVEVQKAFSEAVLTIRPVTIAALRGGFDPNDPGKADAVTWLRVGFFGILLLALYLAFHFSTWERQASILIADMRQNRLEQQEAILRELILRYVADASQSDSAGDARSRLVLFEKTEELLRIQEQIRENDRRKAELDVQFVPLMKLYLDNFGVRISAVYDPARVAANAASHPAASSCEPLPAGAVVLASHQAADGSATMTAGAGGAVNPATLTATAIALFDGDVGLQNRIRAAFMCIVGLPNYLMTGGTANVPPGMYDISRFDDRRTALNLWVLPAIYGALGAIIFFGRGFLNPYIPDPQPMYFLARICVAAFAGIAIGWVWGNGLPMEGVGASGSAGVLLLAFIFGFGIDVFFTLLERLVKVATDAVNRIGATE